jgi:cellobiose epimerase
MCKASRSAFRKQISLLVIIFLVCNSCSKTGIPSSAEFSDEYWKDQAIRLILPNWTKYARDTVFGGFVTNLDFDWKPGSCDLKYPSMIGRHIFSYATAYLMTGDEKYLSIASETKDYLIKYGWDKEYGGWYDMLNRDGSPAAKTKTMFIQIYALTGLAMYYFVTHDTVVLRYIEKGNNLLEEKLWDTNAGGYFNMASREWAVNDSNKSFASQVAPVSGYLLYLALATGHNCYIAQSIRIMNTVLSRMGDPESGWILEDFDKDWNYIPGNPDHINIGHNLEVVWMTLRLALLQKNEDYIRQAESFCTSKISRALNRNSGMWYSFLEKNDPKSHGDYTYWWIQAYGNMFSLISYRFFRHAEQLRDFKSGAGFWNKYFIDPKFGDTYMSVNANGKVRDILKANPYKTSYHSMEHCLINALYLSLWVNHQPVTLYFRVTSPEKETFLFPFPVEDPDLKITRAICTCNHRVLATGAQARSVIIPPCDTESISVTIQGYN